MRVRKIIRCQPLLAVIALIFLLCLRVHGQAAPDNKTYKKTPPYSFKAIAQIGDVVDGLTIRGFITRYGVGVAINDAAQVAWVANTDKGTALFKDQKLIAQAGQIQNGRKILDIADLSISQDGHVAYGVYYAYDPKRDLAQNVFTKRGMNIMQAVCIDDHCICRNGMQIKGLNAKVVSASLPYYDDNGNLNICVTTTKNDSDLFSGIVNGNYVKGKGIDMLRMKMVGRVVTGGQGRQLANAVALVQSNGKGYALRARFYTMNSKGMIAAGLIAPTIVIYPYEDGKSNAGSSGEFPLEEYKIPNFWPVLKGMPGGDWFPTWMSLDAAAGSRLAPNDSIMYSPHGCGMYLNASNQLAFFIGYNANGKHGNALILGTPQNGGNSPAAELTRATTTDASSVTVDYQVNGGSLKSQIEFSVFKSKDKIIDPAHLTSNQVLLWKESKDDQVNNNKHEVILRQPGMDLAPDTSKPYVVVVATVNGITSQTYFKKWMLGVVVHGFAFDDLKTMSWATVMADDLRSVDHFDKAIAFDWTEDSRTVSSSQAVDAGSRLTTQFMSVADALVKPHAGDVVDVHFIGHSRGTVVVSQCLARFANLRSSSTSLMGSYVEVTLLDIHPASPMEDSLLSYADTTKGKAKLKLVRGFQLLAMDPEITFPSGANIHSIDIWCQQTPTPSFPESSGQSTLNLWGESQANNHIKNLCDVTQIVWHDLTGFKDTILGSIGHSEIVQYYQHNVVRTGTLH